MAVTVDDEDYARLVLICSGHFNDPNLEGRLTDIRRRLHMLTTGYTRILFFLIHLTCNWLLALTSAVSVSVPAICIVPSLLSISHNDHITFRALTLLVGHHKEHLACKN